MNPNFLLRQVNLPRDLDVALLVRQYQQALPRMVSCIRGSPWQIPLQEMHDSGSLYALLLNTYVSLTNPVSSIDVLPVSLPCLCGIEGAEPEPISPQEKMLRQARPYSHYRAATPEDNDPPVLTAPSGCLISGQVQGSDILGFDSEKNPSGITMWLPGHNLVLLYYFQMWDVLGAEIGANLNMTVHGFNPNTPQSWKRIDLQVEYNADLYQKLAWICEVLLQADIDYRKESNPSQATNHFRQVTNQLATHASTISGRKKLRALSLPLDNAQIRQLGDALDLTPKQVDRMLTWWHAKQFEPTESCNHLTFSMAVWKWSATCRPYHHQTYWCFKDQPQQGLKLFADIIETEALPPEIFKPEALLNNAALNITLQELGRFCLLLNRHPQNWVQIPQLVAEFKQNMNLLADTVPVASTDRSLLIQN